MGNKPVTPRRSEEEDEGVHINMLISTDQDVLPEHGIHGTVKITPQQYADNLKLFERKARAASISSPSREEHKVRRTISLRQNRDQRITAASSPIPSNLISDLLEISRSFKRHRTPLQKSASAMSLRLVNIEESDSLLGGPRRDRHALNTGPDQSYSYPEKSCSVPLAGEAGPCAKPENGKSTRSSSSSSSETEFDSYKTHNDFPSLPNDLPDVDHEDIEVELEDDFQPPSSLSPFQSPEYINATMVTERVYSDEPEQEEHQNNVLSPRETDSCPSDSDTDSCPSDTDSCPSDDSDEEEGASETDQFPGAAGPREAKFVPYSGERRQRGRMSVITPPSISKVELNLTIKKRVSKSCGDLHEISAEFIDHLKTLRPVEDSVFEEFEMLSQQDRMQDSDDDFRPGKLKRSSSQTITDRELKTIHETQNIWNIPEMVKSSKIALAIMFIGARMGSIVQNNLGHVNNINAEAVSQNPGVASEKTRSLSITNAPKRAIGRSFSFSIKNRAGNINKKISKSKISLKEDIMEDAELECSEEDQIDRSASLPRSMPSSNLSAVAQVSDTFLATHLADNKRCMSLSNLNTEKAEKDLRELAEGGPKRVHSSEGLISPSSARPHHSSCENLISNQDPIRTASVSTADGKNDSSNEFSSDSEDREPRIRLSRSKSISMATRNIFQNKKSALKKKRCPPHNFIPLLYKPEFRCEGCSGETITEPDYVQCTYCEFLVHKTCSELMLDASPPPKEKKSHKSITYFGLLQSKRPNSSELRDVAQSNALRRIPSREPETSLLRRVSMAPHTNTDNHNNHTLSTTGRSVSPTESDGEDYLTDDSDDDSWRGSVTCMSPCVVMTKEQEERLHGISELIETEHNHIRDLKILLRIFKSKMVDRDLVSEEECVELFPALDDLLKSCTALYTELKESIVQETTQSNHMIGNVLIRNYSGNSAAGMCIRDAYARLGAKKLIAEKYYRDKCKDSKTFKLLTEALEAKKVCRRRTYPDFLLAVATRLTKYPPLLKKLFKHTPENHPDHHSLQEAITVIEDALQYINNYVKEANNKAELELFQTRFEVKGRCSRELKDFDLSSDKRRLIHRDQVTLQSMKAGSNSKIVQLFLYNDYMLLLKEKDNKLILNFDDVQYPVIKVKGCLVKNDMCEKTVFMVISNSNKRSADNSKVQPLLYRFSCTTADQKDAWIRLMNEAISEGDLISDTTGGGGLSSDERFDSEDSDIEVVSPEREISVSFDADPDTDQPRNLTLDDIEEQSDHVYLPTDSNSLDIQEEEIDRLVSFLQNLGKRTVPLNRPVQRPAPRPGTAARRAISMHVAEKQKRVEENRRHTTCLSQEELNQAISHSNQTLPSNQTLQDNPVRQKSSDSGYAADDSSNQANINPVLMKMRDCMLWVVQDSKKKSSIIDELKQEVAELRSAVERKDNDFNRLEEELKAVKAQMTENNAAHASSSISRSRPKRVYLNTYSISEEASDNPQTRV